VGFSTARSGLGLYNVGLFAKKLGGAVKCTSWPGRGTRFQVRLPGPVGYSTQISQRDLNLALPSACGKLIAVLDDDLTALRALERVLEELGQEVYADHDPIRWLSVLTDLKRCPDLILLGSDLGKQQALVYLDILRRRWAERAPQTIVLTNYPNHPSVRETSMVAPVLEKPLSNERLKLIIDVLGQRRTLPERGFL
jgi:CheY-like chemotaxis protein